MTRTALGAYWQTDRPLPVLVDALIDIATRAQPHIVACALCDASWDVAEGTECRWCEKRTEANAAFILKPPAPRGYGYATDDDLRHLGYDKTSDRAKDLERWRHDLELAVDAGLITQTEGEQAWQSANQKNSTSSTGTTSTTTPQTKTPSSKDSPTGVAGPPSHPRRKQGNQRSSLPSQWKPPDKDTT